MKTIQPKNVEKDMEKDKIYSLTVEVGVDNNTDRAEHILIKFDRYENGVIYGTRIQDGSEFKQKIDEIAEIIEG